MTIGFRTVIARTKTPRARASRPARRAYADVGEAADRTHRMQSPPSDNAAALSARLRVQRSPGITCEHGAAGARVSAPHICAAPPVSRAMRAPSARNSKVLGNMNARTPGHETKIVRASGAHLVPMVLVAAPHVKMRADAARIFSLLHGRFPI